MKLSLITCACALLTACGATQNSTAPSGDAASAGTAPAAPAAQVGRARLGLSTTAVRLAALRGADFVPSALEVRNDGDADTGPLSVSRLASPFVVSSQCDGQRLAPGASCSVTIDCEDVAEDAPSPVTGTLTVDGDPGGAVTAQITATREDRGTFAIEGGSFGVLRYWEPKSKRVAIRYSGVEASGPLDVAGVGAEFLTLDQWNAPGAAPIGFAITGDECSGKSLTSGDSCFLVVSARFENDGERSATLRVMAPGANAASADVTVSVRTSWVQLTMVGPTGSSVVLSGPDLDAPAVFDATANVPIPTGIASTLRAPTSGLSTFDGWSGDCTGTDDCTVIGAVDGGSAYVTAMFH